MPNEPFHATTPFEPEPPYLRDRRAPEAPWRYAERDWMFLRSSIPGCLVSLGIFLSAHHKGLALFYMMFPLVGALSQAFGNRRAAIQPRRYPVSDGLTEKAKRFALRLGSPAVIVHVDSFGEGTYLPYAFREGRDILISEHLASDAPPGQVDFILARLVAQSGNMGLWHWLLFGTASFVFGLLAGRFIGWAIPLLLLACLAVVIVPRRLARSPRGHQLELQALDATGNLDDALAAVNLLPVIGRYRSNYPWDGAREALIRHWEASHRG